VVYHRRRAAGGNPILIPDDIAAYNFKASFYIMNDCLAVRFADDNPAMAYLMRTDYGPAVYGAIEITNGVSVALLVERLSEDDCWGEAFKDRFNDDWPSYTFIEKSTKRLEKIINGDPPLRVDPVGGL